MQLLFKMIYDVHTHLDFFKEKELEKIMKNSKEVKLIISNSTNLKSFEKNLEISKKYPQVKIAIGLYPEENNKLSDLNILEEFLRIHKKNILALGEIGLDKTEKLDFEIQKELFISQLNIARKYNLPAIIHTRKSEKEVLEILENYSNQNIILHCFMGNFKLINKAKELGFYFSIPPIIVRSEHFQKLVREIPKNKILTETDSPFLSPYKEKINQPIYIRETIKVLSELWKIPKSKAENQIKKNFEKLFLK